MKILWIVGEPGVGKTTLARLLLEPGSALIAKPKWTVGRTVVAAGHYKGEAFDGADTVPYNGAADALRFWSECLATRAQLTILDGDRFSNATALKFFTDMLTRTALAWLPAGPHRLCCVEVVGSEIAAGRRVQRGTVQNASWVKGRATKSQRFAGGFAERLEISAAMQPPDQADKIREWLAAS